MVNEILAHALECHQAGDLNGAEYLYRQALDADSSQADAWYYLGDIYLAQGRLSEAVTSYYRVLELAPGHAAAQNSVGIAFAQQNNWDEAIYWFRQSIQSQPDHAQAYSNLGIALANQGNLAEAESCYLQAIRIKPDFPEAYNNLGLVLGSLVRIPDAIEAYRRALALKPDYLEAEQNLGTALEKAKEFDKAIKLYEKVLRAKPNSADAHNNMGSVLYKLGKYPEAHREFEIALKLKPDYGEAHHNLGNLLVDSGRPHEGIAEYERALQLMPNCVEAHFGRAQARLRLGDFERGWPEFEWRWWRRDFPPRPFSQPVWDGSPLAGRSILLHAEQGMGDTIQFVRYAPLVKRYGGRVIVECQGALLSLLRTCPGIDQLVAKEAELPHFDTHAPLLSLPLILQTTLATIPADIPYLSVDSERINRWRNEMNSIGGRKIGIAWQGNPRHFNDHHRSIRLDRFETLSRIDGIHLFSLQKGPGAEQLAEVAERFSITDVGSKFDDFRDTAAVVKLLDLVITVDSAVAHCAGALGVPVWVLLPYAADWRWIVNRDDSPWYPSMRLFRQPKPCDWEGAFDRVVLTLKERPSGKVRQ
jgi:tetratricopeptide (TPR) repeat protein